MNNNQNKAAKMPTIKRSFGAVVPGTGQIVGGGTAESASIRTLVERAADMLRETYGMSVHTRFNSNGQSGGAYLVTDGASSGLMSNSDVGVSVSEFSVSRINDREHVVVLGGNPDGPDKFVSFHVSVSAGYLRDVSLATNGTGSHRYAYVLVPSLESAVDWLAGHVNLEQAAGRKMAIVQKEIVEVGLAGDGLVTSSGAMATLDLATGLVYGVKPISWHDDDDDSESSIEVCRKTIPITRNKDGEYSIPPDLLAGLKEAVLDDLSAGLKVRRADGSIQDGFVVWDGGADVAKCNDLDGATRVAQALRISGSVEHIWVTKGSDFENVYDDPKP
ncbi:hypothetical protein [Paraburkholderia sp. SIMBA_054]|uniref:hypothetical protein n=1 Tax=Paraburkholderia sp. SIMBA_054 TaxID=3085795 RepID=UPI00397AC85F